MWAVPFVFVREREREREREKMMKMKKKKKKKTTTKMVLIGFAGVCQWCGGLGGFAALQRRRLSYALANGRRWTDVRR